MGSVWLAERADSIPKRKVALKLPHLGWAPGLAERVERERDIVASLEHPHIARLYDAGLDALGRPYLALEYVDGTPIDRYAAEHRLTVPDRLRLFLQVAEAVAHAHAHLVVHRDLKPSNILVTGQGDVRLLDFGIAKLLEDSDTAAEESELTRAGGRALTPEYASPEQVRGEAIGTASDVYSLGVVAYELLTGKRPYTLGKEGMHGLAEAIDTADVPLASRACDDTATRKQLAGDLDAILNKALKKLPSERYATVAAFADDVRRHLADEPVVARPDTAGYRVRKFIVRHALQVSAAALVLIAMVAGAGVALWQAHNARIAAARAEDQATRAEQVKRFALSIFEDADTDSGAGNTTSAADLLVQAQGRVERELGSRPDMAVEVLTSIAFSEMGQGRVEEGLRASSRAVDIGQRTLGAENRLTLKARLTHIDGLVRLGRSTEAKPLVEAMLPTARRIGDPVLLAQLLREWGDIREGFGDAAGMQAAAQESVQVMEKEPAAFTALERGVAYVNLAAVAFKTRGPGLLDAARKGLAQMKLFYGERTSLPVLQARLFVAEGLVDEGRGREGVDELARVTSDIRTLLGPSHPRALVDEKYLGDARFDAGDYAAAAQAYRDVISGEAGNTAHDPENGVFEHVALAEALAAAGEDAEALAEAGEAEHTLGSIKTSDPTLIRDVWSVRGLALCHLGRFAEADRVLTELLAHTPPEEKAERAVAQERLALVRIGQGNARDAVTLAVAAHQVLSTAHAARRRADAERVLGLALLAAGQGDEAAGHLHKALDIDRATQIVVTPEQAATARAIARAETSRPASTTATSTPASPSALASAAHADAAHPP
jgi:serine/threonine-protein kinase